MRRLILIAVLLFFLPLSAQQKFTVYFDFDIDEARNQSVQSLKQWIDTRRDAEILKIYGYADKTGDSLYNIDLSERRAMHVYEELKAAGLKLDNVEEKGFGENYSSTPNNPKDRKVVIYWNQEPVVLEKKPELTEFTKKVVKANKGEKITVPNLHFLNNSGQVLPESRPVLSELLKIMQDNPKLKIDIQGHICCQKIEENEISLKRALTVYNFLLKNGIDKNRLSYKSFGSSRPVYPLPEKNEEQKVANRRVEIEIVEN